MVNEHFRYIDIHTLQMALYICAFWYWDGVCIIGRNTITWNKWIQDENIRVDFYRQDSFTLKWDLIMNIRDVVWLHTGTCHAIKALSNKQDSDFMSYWTLFGEKLKSDYDLIFFYHVKHEVHRSESFLSWSLSDHFMGDVLAYIGYGLRPHLAVSS